MYLVQYWINTGDANPIRQPPRKTSGIFKKILQNYAVVHSSSPWSSHCIKETALSYFSDYKSLNDITKKESYPLSRMDDISNVFSVFQWFSTFELKSRSLSSSYSSEWKEKMQSLLVRVFVNSWLCHLDYVMHLSLMELILRSVTWNKCLVYFENIIIIKDKRWWATWKKWALFQKQQKVNFLAHVISR